MSIQEIFNIPIYKIKLDLNVKKLESFCNKYQHENIVKFNSGNEFAVKLFTQGRIIFTDINKIIEKSLSVDLKIKLKNIDDIIIYQKELINTLKSTIDN